MPPMSDQYLTLSSTFFIPTLRRFRSRPMADSDTRPPKKTITPGAWQEARGLIYAHRGRLALGLALLLVNRLAGLVLPASSKWVIDRVIGQHHPELLLPLALAAGRATPVPALPRVAPSHVPGAAAPRAVTH